MNLGTDLSPLELAALSMPLAALAAVLLDRLLGEVSHFHPLVGFGNLVSVLEKRLNRRSRLSGLISWALAVLPAFGLALWLRPHAPFIIDVLLLYFALGAQSLAEHAEAVAKPLREGRLDEARQRVGYLVSRETSALDESGVAKAGVESVLENAVLAVAVPRGERFITLAARWREAPLVKRSGIRLLTVSQTGEVVG